MTSAPVIVVMGSPHDPHVTRVADEVRGRGPEVVVLDSLAFPSEVRVSMGDGIDRLEVNGRPTGPIAAAYVRDVYISPLSYGIDASEEMEQDWRRTLVAFREKANMLLGLLTRWSRMGIPVYNPRSAEWLQAKPAQLAILGAAGLPVPGTIWTNDPGAVRRFAKGRRVIYKPVAGGAATQELGEEDLTEERLRALAGAPVTFQELLPGENLRVYCIDGEVVASFRITSASIDFRQNEDVFESCEVTAEIAEQCVRAVEVLGLRWGGIDLRADERGRYRFLEVNSSPMFLGFDARGGTDILGSLAGALAGHARPAGPPRPGLGGIRRSV